MIFVILIRIKMNKDVVITSCLSCLNPLGTYSVLNVFLFSFKVSTLIIKSIKKVIKKLDILIIFINISFNIQIFDGRLMLYLHVLLIPLK